MVSLTRKKCYYLIDNIILRIMYAKRNSVYQVTVFKNTNIILTNYNSNGFNCNFYNFINWILIQYLMINLHISMCLH